MQLRPLAGHPYAAEIWPPLKRIRVRNWGVDMSGAEPKLVYVYADGKTQNERTDKVLSVHWDTGGGSAVANDANVEWLGGDTDSEGTRGDETTTTGQDLRG